MIGQVRRRFLAFIAGDNRVLRMRSGIKFNKLWAELICLNTSVSKKNSFFQKQSAESLTFSITDNCF